MKRIKKDNIHCNLNRIDKYDKYYNFIVSAREYGKSTAIWAKILKQAVHHHRPAIVIRRQSADITDEYIESIEESLNPFMPKNKKIKLIYKGVNKGSVDVWLDKDHLLCRIVALSIPKSRMKSLVLKDPSLILFDEYLIDTTAGEKHLKDEIGRFKDLYNTYYRHAVKYGHKVKCWFMGNPYTVFSPYHLWLNIDPATIKEGCKIIGDTYYLECAKLSEELKAYILAHNPLYKFDDSYTRYAFNCQTVNDQRYKLEINRPEGYKLYTIFRVSGKYLQIWQGQPRPKQCGYYSISLPSYYAELVDQPEFNTKAQIISIDFNNLTDGTILMNNSIKTLFTGLAYALAYRYISFKDINAAIYTEELYKVIK